MLPKYKRILLKLSGESLSSERAEPFDPQIIEQYARDIKAITELGVQVALVIGGGNFTVASTKMRPVLNAPMATIWACLPP